MAIWLHRPGKPGSQLTYHKSGSGLCFQDNEEKLLTNDWMNTHEGTSWIEFDTYDRSASTDGFYDISRYMNPRKLLDTELSEVIDKVTKGHLAGSLGISVKTVEAWMVEPERCKGPSLRMILMILNGGGRPNA